MVRSIRRRFGPRFQIFRPVLQQSAFRVLHGHSSGFVALSKMATSMAGGVGPSSRVIAAASLSIYYSWRSVVIGSTWAARHAGTKQAARATARRSALTPARVGTSIGFVAYSIDSMN